MRAASFDCTYKVTSMDREPDPFPLHLGLGVSLPLLDEMYERWRREPGSVLPRARCLSAMPMRNWCGCYRM